jgi:hypothetical protein
LEGAVLQREEEVLEFAGCLSVSRPLSFNRSCEFGKPVLHLNWRQWHSDLLDPEERKFPNSRLSDMRRNLTLREGSL